MMSDTDDFKSDLIFDTIDGIIDVSIAVDKN